MIEKYIFTYIDKKKKIHPAETTDEWLSLQNRFVLLMLM